MSQIADVETTDAKWKAFHFAFLSLVPWAIWLTLFARRIFQSGGLSDER